MRTRTGNPTGRPKGFAAKQSEVAREILVKEVMKKLQPLLKAKFDLALGHYKAITDKEGKVINAYLTDPDSGAIQFLINQVIGKAKETLELDHGDDDPYANINTEEIARRIENVIKSTRPSKGP